MEIHHVYSLVAISLLSVTVYASTITPTPSSQGTSSTVETASSSEPPSSSSIGAATSTQPPSTSAETNAPSTSEASPTSSPAETSSIASVLPDTSTVIPTNSGSSVVTSTDQSVSSPVDTTPTTYTPSSSPGSSSPSSTSDSSSSVATSSESVDTSSITQPPVSASASSSAPASASSSASGSSSAPASATPSVSASASPPVSASATPPDSSSPDTNNASSTPSPTSTSESGNDSSVESSPTSPSSPSASPVEGSTGGATSPGPDSSTSDASSPAAPASPTSSDSTTSSQPTPTSPVESTSVATPAPPVETTQPPLSTSFPSFAAKTDVARYQLPLEFTGDNNGPTTSCNDTALQSELEKKLKTTDGYSETIRTSNKKFTAIYKAKQLYGKMANVTTNQLQVAMSASPGCFNYTAFHDSFQQSFGTFAALTDDYCKADEICNTGYTCRDRKGSPLCISLCEDHACQNDGVCVVVVKEDGQAAAQCRCTDNNEQVFSGAKCETARMNPDRVAAIVGAVLGAFCFILLVALYCMCYRKRDRSGQKYHLSGVYNETYERSSLDMKNL